MTQGSPTFGAGSAAGYVLRITSFLLRRRRKRIGDRRGNSVGAVTLAACRAGASGRPQLFDDGRHLVQLGFGRGQQIEQIARGLS